MNTYFQDVFDSFLASITSYEFLELNEEELTMELTMFMRKSLAKFITKKNIKADYDMEEFNRELTDIEIEIIVYGMIVEWLTPRVNSIELLKPSLSSKDYQIFSQANMLKELRESKLNAEKSFHYWMGRYNLLDFTKDSGN